ncbi:MAG: hypothetical protein DRJ43_01705 [Thermoprotei archaeon]|nr:MAG: hypothetical protein DRJ43_01705 [Thermoprotei archaeon]
MYRLERGSTSYVSGLLARKLAELLREIEDKVRELGVSIRGEPLNRVGFVDGSYVLEERRGACLVLYSASSLEVVERRSIRQYMRGSKEPLIQVLVPKTYSESRASLLMSMLELLAGLDMVLKGVEAIFMDGSYVSALMAPFGYALDVYSRAVKAANRHLNFEVVEGMGCEACEEIRQVLEGERDPRMCFQSIMSVVGRYANRLYAELCSFEELGPQWRKEALDYSVVYFEETAYLSILNKLLEEAGERGSSVFWVAKDSESRYLTEREGILGWLNDLMLLDYAWRDLESVYTKLRGVSFGKPKGHVACFKLIDEVYEKWRDYTVVYFKLGRQGVATQMTYPTRLSDELLQEALSTLLQLSDEVHGYPRPLNYVHNLAVLNPGLARLIADEMYRRSSRGSLMRFMLAPSGRRLLGLVR